MKFVGIAICVAMIIADGIWVKDDLMHHQTPAIGYFVSAVCGFLGIYYLARKR